MKIMSFKFNHRWENWWKTLWNIYEKYCSFELGVEYDTFQWDSPIKANKKKEYDMLDYIYHLLKKKTKKKKRWPNYLHTDKKPNNYETQTPKTNNIK